MINKINSLSTLQTQYKINFKANEPITKPVENKSEVSLTGTEALAVYNTTLIKNPEQLDIKPLEISKIDFTNLDSIEGEKIYTSDGKLHSIIQENEKNKTIIKPFKDNKNKFYIDTTDKKSGHIIRSEVYLLKDKNIDEAYVAEYSPITGKEVTDTNYLNGEPSQASKSIYKPNEDVIVLTKDFNYNEYSISKYNNKHDRYTSIIFDKDKQLKHIHKEKEDNLKLTNIDIDFYNGGILAVDKHERITLPNNFGTEKLNDANLIPSKKYNMDFDAKGLEGEKTYYSNGAIETNSFEYNGEKVKAYFTPNGEVEKLELNNKIVTFDNETQRISEKLENDSIKITTIYNDKPQKVRLENNSDYKEISFNKSGKPYSYQEGQITFNGEYEKNLSMYFNKLGMLEEVFNF